MANINALKKLAYDEDNDTAGIGTWNQNALGKAVPDGAGGHITITPPLTKNTVPANKGMYFPNLLENAKKDPKGTGAALSLLNWVAPKEYVGKDDSDIKNPDLAKIREDQAEQAAKTYFGNLEGVRQYLIERGEANQKHQNKDNTVPFAPVDLPRLMQLLNGKKLTPAQLKLLPAVQNSMAMSGKPNRSGATA